MKTRQNPEPVHRQMWGHIFESEDGDQTFHDSSPEEREFCLASLLYLVNDNLCRVLASGRSGNRRLHEVLKEVRDGLLEDDGGPTGEAGDDDFPAPVEETPAPRPAPATRPAAPAARPAPAITPPVQAAARPALPSAARPAGTPVQVRPPAPPPVHSGHPASGRVPLVQRPPHPKETP